MAAYLALDLGAGSGRAIVGVVENGRIHLDEVHRFANRTVKLGDTLYWDFLSLFAEIRQGIRAAVAKGYDLKGIGVDTWGVDFGLTDRGGRLLSNPVCYRDGRTAGMQDEAEKHITAQELYGITGIQQMDINTLFQMLSLKVSGDPSLHAADKLLFTPDLINFFLTGKAANEYTIASTSQMLDARTGKWSADIFGRLGLPVQIMGDIVYPGMELGFLRRDIADETNSGHVKVFAVGSHDTASAIAAIPERGDGWAFLSSGTWSLLGMVRDEPELGTKAMKDDFTNEGGTGGKVLFMRNITGLWLLQRLMAEWSEEGVECTYESLLAESETAEPFRSIVNSDDPTFNNPASMTAAIVGYCKSTSQPAPRSKGEFVRCVLESLALKYAVVAEKLKLYSPKEIDRLHIVGGGARNETLNRYIAAALDVEVAAGLNEATAVGNVLQQAIADGTLSSWEEAHKLVLESFDFRTYQPQDHEIWNRALAEKRHLFDK